MHSKLISVFLSFASAWPCLADTVPVQAKSDAVWDAIGAFEGGSATVTGDFDCQGLSVGIAQWNIGKSQADVKKIILSLPNDQLSELMPKFGQRFVSALNGTRKDALAFVRSFQAIERPDSCDAKTRNARWNAEGRLFVKELSRALATESSIKTQRSLRADIFNSGLQNATRWAKSIRGENASPTPREIAYFVDMQIFNGGGFSKFGLASRPLSPDVRSVCTKQVIDYLRTANDEFLLHKKAARRNATLLNPQSLSDGDKDLFCLSHQVAMKLNANYSRQFRLTVINRRAAILFGGAYYSDRDSDPTKVVFAQ